MKRYFILFLVGLISRFSVFSQINFLPPTTYYTGYGYDMAKGDFNGDGKMDLATLDYNNNAFNVYINTGTGGNFAAPVSYGPIDATRTYAMDAGDFNNDGNIDLVFAGFNSVVIYRGTATGTFGTKSTITPPTSPSYRIAVGDYGNDGNLDFAVSNATNTAVFVYRGNGNVTFTGPTSIVALAARTNLSSGDINNDNRDDLIFSNPFNSSISILTASGTGIFNSRVDITTNSNPEKVEIGDLNGDGRPDIMVPNSSYMCALWNLGGSTFSAPDCALTPNNCGSATILDYNLDGNKDVVTSNFTSSTFSFFQGSGNTNFTSQTNWATANGQLRMVSADFNNDGKTDLATVNYMTSVLGIYLNNTIKVASATVSGTGGLSLITAVGGSLQMVANYLPTNANVNTLVGWSISPTSLAGINSSGVISATSINNGTVTVTATFGSVVARRTIYIGGQQPIITNFAPQMVFPNQPIVINGSGFNSTPSLNTVWINRVPCQVTAASSNQLTIIPPKIGFAKSKITVLNESTRLLGTSLDYVTPLFFGSTNISTSDLGPAVTLSGGNLNYTATGDMDGDGMADIVSVASNVLNIQRNNGTLGSILGSSFTLTSIVLTYSVNSLDLADMDMDGKLDILCSNASNGNVHIIKNLCSPGTITASSFGALVTIPGNASNKLVAGDLNNDGKLDIISIEAGVGVIVFPNIGPVGTITSSSFGTPFIINSGVTSLDFKVEDLDRDGFLDIAVANGNNLYLIRNNGILNTLTVSNFSIAGSTLGDPGCFCDLELDDFDGDKKVDVLFGSQNTRFNFFQNNSSLGNLSTTSFLPKSTMTTSMAHYPSLLDLNGDSKTDLFQIDASADFIYGYQNLNSTGSLNGANFLQSFNRLEVLPNYVYYNFSNHDVDGDGRVDMVAQLNASSYNIGLTIFQNLNTISYSPTSGSFGAFVSISGTNLASATGVSFNGSPASFTVLNPNMLVATVPLFATSGPLRVYNNFYTATGLDFTVNPSPPVITDFTPLSAFPNQNVVINGSGFDAIPSQNLVWIGNVVCSVISSNYFQMTIKIPSGITNDQIQVLNRTTGLLGKSKEFFAPLFIGSNTISASSFSSKIDFTSGANPYFVATGDLDGDGKSDIAVANYTSNSVSIYQNLGNGGSITGTSFASKVDLTTGTNPLGISICDLDNDGKMDIAVTNNGTNSISIFKNIGSGSTITGSSFTSKIDISTGSGPTGLAVGDLDGDGKSELAVACSGNNAVAIHKNLVTGNSIGGGSFATGVNYATATNPFSVALGDLDSDGKSDLVVTNNGSSSVSIFHNRSIGNTISGTSFAPKFDLISGMTPSVRIGDLDGDGKLDLAIVNFGSNTLSLYNNKSSGNTLTGTSFASRIDLVTGTNPNSLSIGDLNGDGRPEVAVTNANGASLSVFYNKSSGSSLSGSSFASKFDFPTGISPYGVGMGDFDGDGKADIVITNYGPGTISVYQNRSSISFTPTVGGAGTLVSVYGSNMTTVSAFTINNTVVPFTIQNSSLLTATVVSGVASGPVSAYNAYSTSTGADFTFLLPQTITGFNSIAAQPLGSPAFTITGVGATSGLTVTFAGNNLSVASVAPNGVININGAGTVTITAFQPGNNLYAAAQSVFQVLTVTCPIPQWAIQPISATVCGGIVQTFTSSATGLGLTYAWSNGQTGNTMTTSLAGSYMVSVSGVCGTLTSTTVGLTVLPLTQIVTQPVSSTVCSGIVKSFTVSAAGLGLSYAWSNGQTGTIMSTSVGGTNFTVTASGICGNVVSNPAGLNAIPITQILSQPQNQIVGQGSFGFFTVSVAGANINYLWNNGSNGAIMSTSVPGSYLVTVSGTCGMDISATATLSVSSSVITVSSATISGGSLQINIDKGSLQFSSNYFPLNANANTLIGWSVSSNGVASISGSGLLSALNNGIVTVTGSYGFITASQVVTITGQIIPVSSATVSGFGGVNSIATNGGNLQFVSQTSPVFANTNTSAGWSVSSNGVASISGSGLLTALANGLVTVTGTFGTVSATQVVAISGQIIPVTSATVSGLGGINTITTLGGTLPITANYYPLIATNTVPSWSIYPNGVATIDGITGVLTALSNGTVTVTGTFGSVSAITIITVTGQNIIIPVSSVTIGGANGISTITIVGGILPFTAQISPANATYTTVSWSVSPNSIATINGFSGVLTAINDGIVTVTGTIGTVVGISIVTISGQYIVVTPTITFTGIPTLTFGGSNISLKALASNGQSVSFLTSDASVLGINNATGVIIGAGTATITAFVGIAGTSSYVQAAQVVTIRKARQSILYSQVPIQYIGNPAFQVSVSATSGLSPTLTISDSSSILLKGNMVQVLGIGVTSILAQQAGNANYLPAEDVLIPVFVADNGSNDLAIFGKDVVPRLNLSNYYISEPDSSKTYEWFYSGSGVTFDTSAVNTSLAGIYFQSNATSGNVLVVIYDKNKHVVGVETRAINVFNQTQNEPVGNNLHDPQCLQVVNNCKGSYIESFEISKMGQINASQCSTDGFGDFTRMNVITKLAMGNTYSASITVGPNGFKTGVKYGGLWIDYNNNGSFSDPEDFMLSSYSEDSVLHFKNMLIRNTPDFAGSRRLRIRMRSSGNFKFDESCPLVNESGETEDYTVFLMPVTKVETPDIITPNGDNLNDYFIVKGMLTDKSSKLTVFDQFGNQKYTNDNYQNEWNGTDQKGTPLKESTYFYVYVNGDITLKGFVEVKY